MSIIDHVSELRAELAVSILTPHEREALEAELQAALSTLANTRACREEAEAA